MTPPRSAEKKEEDKQKAASIPEEATAVENETASPGVPSKSDIIADFRKGIMSGGVHRYQVGDREVAAERRDGEWMVILRGGKSGKARDNSLEEAVYFIAGSRWWHFDPNYPQ